MERSATARAIAPTELPPEIQAGLSAEDRRRARLCLTVLGVLGTGGMIGVASSLYLLNHYPLLLIALSPIGRHLVLVAPTVNPIAFVFVGTARRLLFYTASFHLGRALGPAGIVWLESRSERVGRFIRWLERLFQRASRTVVFFLPGPGVSTIAGISGMRAKVFFPIIAAGLVLRMVLLVWFAEWLRVPIEAVLAFVDEYWIPGTVLLVAGVVLYRWRQIRRQRA